MGFQAHTLELLILVLVANAAPVAIALALGSRFSTPLDGGCNWVDQRPLLGKSKTLRGIVASFVVTPIAAVVIDMPMLVGALVAAGAMLGDLLSSFCKRRLNISSHGSALGIDQLPECILPLAFVQPILQFGWSVGLWVIGLFCLVEWVLSYLLVQWQRWG